MIYIVFTKRSKIVNRGEIFSFIIRSYLNYKVGGDTV
ncbi:hypothetical protein TpMuguga_03g02185 [Theileria parva strain Muguga]|nr:uncharacterized protein TpMuguga_03g02185 [Theileria parva strain Muguga]KAF5153158.1 hypothetical protein TpMuguga_03g02185 [Theileria parva strain Muguga]